MVRAKVETEKIASCTICIVKVVMKEMNILYFVNSRKNPNSNGTQGPLMDSVYAPKNEALSTPERLHPLKLQI